MALHLAAIVFYTLVKKERLVQAMWHGEKPATYVPADQAIASSQLWKAAIVIVVAAGCVVWLVHAAPPAPTSIDY